MAANLASDRSACQSTRAGSWISFSASGAMLLGMVLLPAAIPSPSTNAVDLGPFTVHVYGLCYALAVITAVAIARRRWETQGGSRELVYDVALWGFPAGIVGARLYYLATTPGDSFGHWWGPFAIWEGGLGIWGGIALGTLVGLWRIRRAGADVARFMDAAAPALLVAQAIGRIGNYFNQELFGRPTDLSWALEIDPAHRPERYLAQATFHPTRLYELLWNLALAAALVWLGHHRRIRPPGLFALYVAGYCAFRIVDELLRVDPAAHVLGVRWNLVLSIRATNVHAECEVRAAGGVATRRVGGGVALCIGVAPASPSSSATGSTTTRGAGSSASAGRYSARPCRWSSAGSRKLARFPDGALRDVELAWPDPATSPGDLCDAP